MRSVVLAGAVLASPAALLALLLISIAEVWHSRWFGGGMVAIVSAATSAGQCTHSMARPLHHQCEGPAHRITVWRDLRRDAHRIARTH